MRKSSTANKRMSDVCKKSIQDKTQKHKKSTTHSINTRERVLCEIFQDLYEPQNKKLIFNAKNVLKKHILKFVKLM